MDAISGKIHRLEREDTSQIYQGYDGEIAHIGNLQLTINEATLREVT